MARAEQTHHELLSHFEDSTIDLQHLCREIDVELARRSGWGLTGPPSVLLARMEEFAESIRDWISQASSLSVHSAEEPPSKSGNTAAPDRDNSRGAAS